MPTRWVSRPPTQQMPEPLIARLPTVESIAARLWQPPLLRIRSACRSALPTQGGGETAALARLPDYAVARHLIGRYADTRNQLLGRAFSTKFSTWLANGSLSARQV